MALLALERTEAYLGLYVYIVFSYPYIYIIKVESVVPVSQFRLQKHLIAECFCRRLTNMSRVED